ncbi:MAG: VWA domain-containing protein, partial [Rhodobacteraceae bacterium]|nr:VWA domain-containing protein [Paracoccaceae bacterium]
NPPAHWRAPKGYRPVLPVPMWPDLRGLAQGNASEVASLPTDGTPEEAGDGTARKTRRLKADQAERKDSLILYKFEAMLTWAEMMNINRRVEDDDLDTAKKAAEDHEEIVLGQISKAPATKLKLHLDLAPEDVDRERIAGQFTYPEWDARGGVWLPDHCRVLAAPVAPAPDYHGITDPAALRRVRAVRRQFEALRPARRVRHAQPDGEELDLDACLRSIADLRATGRGSDRIWQQARPENRDLAVSILLDVSRSTESAVTGRPVIEIAREALTALAWGLDACGDRFAVQGFCSLRRDRVWLHDCKSFDEPMGTDIEARIHALRPAFYTRLGAAVRHAAQGLAKEGRSRRLMIVITDGKPNDLDHYEGRHGIEDSAMAVREARRAGHAVFGITIDRDAQSWFPRIFGQGGFQVIRDPDRLITALPEIYRQLVV